MTTKVANDIASRLETMPDDKLAEVLSFIDSMEDEADAAAAIARAGDASRPLAELLAELEIEHGPLSQYGIGI